MIWWIEQQRYLQIILMQVGSFLIHCSLFQILPAFIKLIPKILAKTFIRLRSTEVKIQNLAYNCTSSKVNSSKHDVMPSYTRAFYNVLQEVSSEYSLDKTFNLPRRLEGVTVFVFLRIRQYLLRLMRYRLHSYPYEWPAFVVVTAPATRVR